MEVLKNQEHGELIKLCWTGDRSAQQKLYNLYARNMFNTAMRITGDYGDASDAVQEAFIEVFVNIKTYRQESTFGYWLKQIVVNKSISLWRKKREDLYVALDNVEIADDETGWNEEQETAVLLEAERVKQAIKQLAEGYRIVITLYLIEGYDHEEISQILKVSTSTVRTQYIRGKKKLIEILKNKAF